MLNNDIHCFWHQEDDRTITSKGFVWTYEGKDLGRKSIACWMDADGNFPSSVVFGICTDYPDKVKEILEQN
jgi:DNA gyrase inhibitor GyrI